MNRLQELAQQLTKESSLKDLIPWSEIHRYLPFAIKKENGNSRSHIINDSIYTIETARGSIEPGITLCRKRDETWSPILKSALHAPCQGCLEIARGLAMKHATEGNNG